MLFREYAYSNNKYVSNTSEPTSYVETVEVENSSFYELEGEDFYD